jgi:hypothetical protein
MEGMKKLLGDLWTRLVVHWQSSATALSLVLITFLQDHGITLSETNKSELTAKIVLLVTALIKLVGKDTGASKPEEKEQV